MADLILAGKVAYPWFYTDNWKRKSVYSLTEYYESTFMLKTIGPIRSWQNDRLPLTGHVADSVYTWFLFFSRQYDVLHVARFTAARTYCKLMSTVGTIVILTCITRASVLYCTYYVYTCEWGSFIFFIPRRIRILFITSVGYYLVLQSKSS